MAGGAGAWAGASARGANFQTNRPIATATAAAPTTDTTTGTTMLSLLSLLGVEICWSEGVRVLGVMMTEGVLELIGEGVTTVLLQVELFGEILTT